MEEAGHHLRLHLRHQCHPRLRPLQRHHRALDAIHIGSQSSIGSQSTSTVLSLHQAGYQYLFAPWLHARLASLAYALAIVALNGALLYPLYRKRIFLHV